MCLGRENVSNDTVKTTACPSDVSGEVSVQREEVETIAGARELRQSVKDMER